MRVRRWSVEVFDDDGGVTIEVTDSRDEAERVYERARLDGKWVVLAEILEENLPEELEAEAEGEKG